jgi:hypothetical protein
MAVAAMAQQQQKKKAFKANARVANTAKEDRDRQFNIRQSQEATETATKKLRSALKQREAFSTSITAGAEAGAFGQSFGLGLIDVSRQGLEQRTAVSANQSLASEQLREERKGSETQRVNQIAKIAKPTNWGALIAVGSAAASGYAMGGGNTLGFTNPFASGAGAAGATGATGSLYGTGSLDALSGINTTNFTPVPS